MQKALKILFSATLLVILTAATLYFPLPFLQLFMPCAGLHLNPAVEFPAER
jgi:hypothetical protein